MDESVKTKGHAFLTSSSENEAAQESDKIGGSFFTHYLVSAIRGAADTTMDKRVTLNEAYSYASAETLARTENTIGGAQHPAYDINLTGSGDLVLTDLRASSAIFKIANDIHGRLFIRNSQSRLAAELHKAEGIPATLALPPGMYSIMLETGGKVEKAYVRLINNNTTTLTNSDFRPVSRESTIVRGNGDKNRTVYKRTKITLTIETETSRPRKTHKSSEAYKSSETHKSFSFNLFDYSKVVSGIQTALTNMVLKNVNGVQFAVIGNNTGGEISGVQAAGIYNISGEKIRGWQTAGIFNITDSDIQGGQIAGIFNLTEGNVSNFQGAGIFNLNYGNARWFQGAGVFNLNIGSFNGFQSAGIANLNIGDFYGFQGAGIANLNRGSFNGFQAAGIFSASHDTNGIQAGLINISGNINGVQAGLVNVGNYVNGVQAGLVNISNDIHGLPIGLINISLHGLHDFSSWSDTEGITYFGFQLGTRYLYTLLYGGFPFNNGKDELAVGLGSGFHIPVYPFYFELDLSAKYISSTGSFISLISDTITPYDLPALLHPSARISAGFTIFKSISIFGGVLFDTKFSGTFINSGFFKGKPITTFYRSIPSDAPYPWQEFGDKLGIEIYAHWFLGLRI